MSRYFGVGAMPSRKHASTHEAESVFDWLRRQKYAERKAIPPRGITQPQPAGATASAMVNAITKKKAPAATGAKNQNNTLNREKN